jgi:hypothetical protein
MTTRTSDPATWDQLALLIEEAQHHGGRDWLDYDWPAGSTKPWLCNGTPTQGVVHSIFYSTKYAFSRTRCYNSYKSDNSNQFFVLAW